MNAGAAVAEQLMRLDEHNRRLRVLEARQPVNPDAREQDWVIETKRMLAAEVERVAATTTPDITAVAVLREDHARLEKRVDDLDRSDDRLHGLHGDVAAMRAELTRVELHVSRLLKLEKKLEGDWELREKYEAGKANYPNIPEPPPGALELISRSIERATAQGDAIGVKLQEMAGDVAGRLAFARRLEAFFGPMLQGMNPPLDGHQIATKEYVDTGIARFAGAIRSEMVTYAEQARDLARELTRKLVDGWTAGGEPRGVSIHVAEKLAWAVKLLERQEYEATVRAAQPTRLRMLVAAITGRTVTS